MALSKKEIEALLRSVGLTEDDEVNCEQCLCRVAEFAERELDGKSVPEGLKAIEQHLAICGECREEYEALRRALEDIGD